MKLVLIMGSVGLLLNLVSAAFLHGEHTGKSPLDTTLTAFLQDTTTTVTIIMTTNATNRIRNREQAAGSKGNP